MPAGVEKQLDLKKSIYNMQTTTRHFMYRHGRWVGRDQDLCSAPSARLRM